MPFARTGRHPASPRAWVVLSLCALLTSCAAVPSQEMSDARRSLDAAREANAGALVPGAMASAESALEEASAALRAGKYDAARESAGRAQETAILARQLATRLATVDTAIAAARAAGKPWQGAQELLGHARAASREGALARALEIAGRAQSLVQ